MQLKEFKYVFLDIGGGWAYIHDLYGITPTGEVYYTNTFPRHIYLDTEIACDLIGKLESTELGLQPRSIHGICDASYLTVLNTEKNPKNDLTVVYQGDECSENNPILFNQIKEIIRERSRKEFYERLGIER